MQVKLRSVQGRYVCVHDPYNEGAYIFVLLPEGVLRAGQTLWFDPCVFNTMTQPSPGFVYPPTTQTPGF